MDGTMKSEKARWNYVGERFLSDGEFISKPMTAAPVSQPGAEGMQQIQRDGQGRFCVAEYTTRSGESGFMLETLAQAKDLAGRRGTGQPSPVEAFWAPQGGSVGIPARPGPNDPRLVFTPDFSGCTLTVEKIPGQDCYRVRHVEGNKTREQFTEVDRQGKQPGEVLIAAFAYYEYGNVSRPGVMSTQSFAYMQHDGQHWNIRWQGREGTVGANGAKIMTVGSSGIRDSGTTKVTEDPQARTGPDPMTVMMQKQGSEELRQQYSGRLPPAIRQRSSDESTRDRGR
jgi:hypothetical protein